jgi:hypothetical protein
MVVFIQKKHFYKVEGIFIFFNFIRLSQKQEKNKCYAQHQQTITKHH